MAAISGSYSIRIITVFITLGILSLIGFHYSGIKQKLSFDSREASDHEDVREILLRILRDSRHLAELTAMTEQSILSKYLRNVTQYTADHWNNMESDLVIPKLNELHVGKKSPKKVNTTMKTKGVTKQASAITKTTNTNHPELRFCPFQWKDCYTAYVPTNCSLKVTKVEEVVTVILNFMAYPDAAVRDKVLKGLAEVHPNIAVLAAWPSGGVTPQAIMTNLRYLEFPQTALASDVWNALVREVKTTYVLVARNVNFMDSDIELDRMLRVMSNLSEDAIIGGSSRTPDGKWKMSCEQMSLRNYTLSFKSGYNKSTKDGCVYCDYTDGPFVAKTAYLDFKAVALRDDTAVFVNFFVTKRKAGIKVFVCPDAMYHVNDPNEKIYKQEYWLATAKRLKLEIIRINGKMIRLPCSKVGLGCSASGGIALAPCCMQRLSNEIAFLLNGCAIHNIFCHLRSGNLIGAVKMRSTLPWELDGDFYVLKDNHTAFRNLKPYFVKNGFSVSGTNPVNFRKRGSPYRIEVYRVPDRMMENFHYISRGMNQTLVEVDGNWVKTIRNPGRQSMREYEMSIYKHSQHNSYFGKTPLARYSERKYKKCAKPGFHACLDQYATDGNIQFYEDFFNTF